MPTLAGLLAQPLEAALLASRNRGILRDQEGTAQGVDPRTPLVYETLGVTDLATCFAELLDRLNLS